MKHTFFNKLKSGLQASGISKKGFVLWLLAAVTLLVICFALIGLSSSAGGHRYPVYITEVLASNTAIPNADGRCCDFIELYNSADYPIDLSGFQLGDLDGSSRYRFPQDTVLEPGSYLAIYCDKTVDSSAYADFSISRSGGETFCLIATNGAVADKVVTIPMDPNQSMILLDSGEWGLSGQPTPGTANTDIVETGTDVYNSGVSPVRITEFSSADTGYVSRYALQCDWVELYNTSAETVDISGYTLSDNVGNDKFTFPTGTLIPAGEYLVVWCSDTLQAADLAPFGLSQMGEDTLVLKDAGGMIVELIGAVSMSENCSLALDADGVWAETAQPSPGFDNTAAGHAAYLQSIGAAEGTIVISEIMAASQAVLPNSFSEFSDWVELYNTGSQTVNLAGWFLSDDPAAPRKWQFPDLELQPGQRVILYCSGRDTVVASEIHTGFSLSSGGESLILSSYIGSIVDAVTFGASENNCSLVLDSGEAVSSIYPTPGYPNDMEGYEAFCASQIAPGPLAIWEVMTSNDQYLPQALGECYDWVELRNISDAAIRLSGYSISDDAEDPRMYFLPDKTLNPGESIVIILSGDPALSTSSYAHAGFSLDAISDQLFLFDSNGALLDYVNLSNIPRTYSYGRSDSVGGFYYMTPTPGKANNGGFLLVSSQPLSDIAPGVYTGEEGYDISLEADGLIYYTLDGSEPDTGSLLYSTSIHIDKTTVLRAVCIEDGKLPSEIYTATFIIGTSHSIPVVSLVTDPGNLWGKDGIYKSGDITIKEENRPANIAYWGEDGSFSLDCEISLHGATTVTAFEKKSFSLRFQDDYDGPLYYDLFEDGEVTAFRSLILRTAHESTYSTQMRDALMGYVASTCSDTLLCQKYKYVALYINGEYWGLYALRELHSETHYASYMDVPVDSVTIMKQYVQRGSSLYDLYEFCGNHSLKSAENYAYAESMLDMSSFADWIIFESYVDNIDINGNMRYYYCSIDGLWRCGLSDVDLGMFRSGGFESVGTTFHHGRIVGSLMENETFQDLLATRLAELLAGPLSDENMIATIDMLADTIRDEIPRENERWGCPPATWERFVQNMRDFCDGRAEEMIDSLCSYLHFTREEKYAYFGDLLD